MKDDILKIALIVLKMIAIFVIIFYFGAIVGSSNACDSQGFGGVSLTWKLHVTCFDKHQ